MMSLNSQKASFLSRSSQNNFFLIYFSQKKKKDRKISIFDKNRGLTPLKQYSLKKILFFLEFNQTSFFYLFCIKTKDRKISILWQNSLGQSSDWWRRARDHGKRKEGRRSAFQILCRFLGTALFLSLGSTQF